MSDLIKRKRASSPKPNSNIELTFFCNVVIRENDSPEKALRFTNLYSRLLTQPVLNHKWEMLYFLYQLSDPDLEAANDLSSPKERTYQQLAAEHDVEGPHLAQANGGDDGASRHGPSTFQEAFANGGLPHLPERGEVRRAQQIRVDRSEKPENLRRTEEDKEDATATAVDPQENRGHLPNKEPSESALLRDLPFTLQGLSSSNLAFTNDTALRLPATLPVPIIGLLHTLAEPSLLYKGLAEFVESSEGDLVGQSFRSALGVELRSYLGLVATLEGQIRRALAMLDPALPKQGIGKAGVTLKRCVIWTREATLGLRLMSLMVGESRGERTLLVMRV